MKNAVCVLTLLLVVGPVLGEEKKKSFFGGLVDKAKETTESIVAKDSKKSGQRASEPGTSESSGSEWANNLAGSLDESKVKLDEAIGESTGSGDSVKIACNIEGDNIKLSLKERAKTVLAKKLISKAAKNLQLGEIELPDSIENVCEAESRLAFIERSTKRWNVSVVTAVQQAAEALEIDYDIEAYRAFLENDALNKLDDSDIVSFGDTLEEDLERVEVAMAEKQVDQAEQQQLLAKSSANLQAALLQGLQIGAWDKRMLEFMGDNTKWTTKNYKRAKTFVDHLKLLGNTVGGVQKVSSAFDANKKEGIDTRLYEDTLAEREKENEAFGQEVLAELQL